jgi:uncharacterized protein YndB with AHSA1/START domain
MTNTAIDVESKTLRMERDYKASPERIFEAFTVPEQACQWWGPEGMTCEDVEFELVEGGSWQATIVDPDGGRHFAVGVYKVIERPHRLVYTWGWLEGDARGHETTVDIRLTKIEGGTRLTLVHGIFETTEDRDDHGEGWTGTLNSLVKFLE